MIIDIRAALITGGALVTAAQIGRSADTVGPATAAGLVLAGVLFSGAALTALTGPRRRCPDD